MRKELFSETLIPSRELSLILSNVLFKSPLSKEQLHFLPVVSLLPRGIVQRCSLLTVSSRFSLINRINSFKM